MMKLFLLLWTFLSPISLDGKTNVLVIYTDDHRYSGVHALGGQAVSTPHMDALVREGLSFSRAYLMGSFVGATCVPSRASLLSGRSLFDLQGSGYVIPPTHTTMGECFHDAGYRTHIVGKWHQDQASLKRSFVYGNAVMASGVYLEDHYRMPLCDWSPQAPLNRENAYRLIYNEEGEVVRRSLTGQEKRGPVSDESEGPHTSEIFAQEAIRVIQTHSSDQPLFLYLAFHAPHDPRQAPRKFREMYSKRNIVLPPSYLPQHPFDNGHLILRDEKLAPWPRTLEVAQQELAAYYAIITHLDEQIGRVMEALKASPLADETLVVFAGDSGLAVGCHGLMGKQNVYDEGGVHVPLVFWGKPLQQKAREIPAFCYLHDIFPTLCDLTKMTPPHSITGKSLLPVIHGKAQEIHDHTYHAYQQFQRAYRKGDYKLIEYVRAAGKTKRDGEFTRGSRVTQLFHYEKDPWEIFNLADFPEHAKRVVQMREEMRHAATQWGDSKEKTGQAFDFWDYYESSR